MAPPELPQTAVPRDTWRTWLVRYAIVFVVMAVVYGGAMSVFASADESRLWLGAKAGGLFASTMCAFFGLLQLLALRIVVAVQRWRAKRQQN